jgi:hypothetical protein
MSVKEAYPRLVDALGDVRRQWRLHKLLEGTLLLSAGVGIVLTLLIVADNLWQPGKAGRVLLAALLWGGLAAAILSLIVRRWLEDRRDDFFAALVERRHPELSNRLINALQLGRGTQGGVSRDLIDAIVRDADRSTTDLDLGDSIDRRPTTRAGLWALAAVVIIGGYAIARPPYFANGLERVLLPLGDIDPYTRTRIVVDSIDPKDTRIAEGSPVTIEARVEGEVPASATLHRRGKAGSWQLSQMLADDDRPDTFRFKVQQASEAFDYYIAAGDARSPQFHVRVDKPPQVERMTVAYTLPDYADRKTQTIDPSDGEISGIAGTRVTLSIRPSKPLQSAQLLPRAGRAIDLVPQDNGTWTTSFVVWAEEARPVAGISGRLVQAPTTYQIKLLDTEGYPNHDPLWRPIALVRDHAPVVGIQAPGDRLSVKVDATIPLTVEARDDFGLDRVRLLCRVGDAKEPRVLFDRGKDGKPASSDRFAWDLRSAGLRVGQRIEYWAEAIDRNVITGPGKGESRRLSVDIVAPETVAEKFETKLVDYADELRALIKLQRTNRAQSGQGAAFGGLVKQEKEVRERTVGLARSMERDGLPLVTMVKELDELSAGLIAEALKLLESGRDAENEGLAGDFRSRSLPVQDKIVAKFEELLRRLERNEQARKELRKIEKKDRDTHQKMTTALAKILKDLDELLKDQTELAGKFERLPKREPDEAKDERLKAMKDLEKLSQRTQKWARGSVNELTKLPEGFIKDFDMRPDAKKVYEEIEKAAERSKAEKMDVALEDLGAGLGTKMKEDLEMWLADSPDNVKWVLEEPLNKKPFKVPEMPLPKALEDLVGDLLQKADEFDKDADDVTSAWGDNLDQAGWGVSDGPISTFSAKGKTGNDQPNNMELTGRSGDGRRGKSSGQMVGDTSRALPGRKTPARVGKEKYEPGQLKQQAQDDPAGSTGGGKVAGSGRRGLQGGSPPPPLKQDLGRLSAKQAGLREKAEQVAQKLDTAGVTSTRLKDSISLMKSVEKDLIDGRYEDGFRKRREAMQKLRSSVGEMDQSVAARISRARELPEQLRKELLQSADDAYPPGYEGLLKNYYKALSTSDK